MQVNPHSKDAYNLIHDGILAFGRASEHGMRVDVAYCLSAQKHLTRKIARIQRQFEDTKLMRDWKATYGADTNINSNPQLQDVLYRVRGITPQKYSDSGKVEYVANGFSNKGSTAKEALKALDEPDLDLYITIKEYTKLRDTYLEGLIRETVDGICHPFFNLHTVITFRSSSSNPNFQNMPNRIKEYMNIIRRAIFPRKGHLIFAVDFSGVEVKIACCYTQDQRLVYDVMHGDMHKDMACELYLLDDLDQSVPGEKNLRQGGKNGFVFPQFYGDYYGNCAENLLKWARLGSLKDGTPALVHLSDKKLITLDKNGRVKSKRKFIDHVAKIEDDFWNVRYRVYTKWKKTQWELYQKQGYIDTYTGFRCGGILNPRQVGNTAIQGTAFHMLLWSFIQLDKMLYAENWDSKLFGQIHDELVLCAHPDERPEVAKRIKRITTVDLLNHYDFINIPLEVEAESGEVDESWNLKKPYELPALIIN